MSPTVKNLPIKKNLISTGNEGRRAINVTGENDLWGEEERVWVVGERLAYHKLMNYQFPVRGSTREEAARRVNMLFKIFIGVLQGARHFLKGVFISTLKESLHICGHIVSH